MCRDLVSRKRQKGASILEFSLVLPLLLFLLTGIVEGGRIFTHLTWLSQIAFQTALAGVDDPDQNTSTTAMNARFTTLFQAQSARRNLQDESANPVFSLDPANRLVTVRLNGAMTILNQIVPAMGFSVAVTVPQLIDQNALSVSQAAADGFANPPQIEICNINANVGFGVLSSCSERICNGVTSGSRRCYCRMGENLSPCS